MPKESFKTETVKFLAKIHHLASESSGLAAYEQLREELLTQNENLGICASALDDVICATCETTRKGPRWAQFGHVVDYASSDNHNERSRIRALATVTALWSLEVVRHYGWDNESKLFLSTLRICARKCPSFSRDFIPRANYVMVQRHQQSLINNKVPAIGEHYVRSRAQSSRSPLNTRDVAQLASDADDNPVFGVDSLDIARRLTGDCITCCVSIPIGDKTLQQLRRHRCDECLLGFDGCGLLVPRKDAVESSIACTSCRPHPLDALGSSPASTAGEVQPEPSPTGSSPKSITVSDGQPLSTDITSYDSDMTSSTQGYCSAGDDAGNPPLDDLPSWDSEIPEQNQLLGRSPSAHTPWSLVDFDQTPSRPAFPVESSWTAGNLQNLSSTRPDVFIGSPFLFDQQELSLEQSLLKEHSANIASYLEEFGAGGSQRGPNPHYMGSKWLQASTRMAKIFADADSKLGRGTASNEAEADVLYYSASRFCQLAESGKKFMAPVVVKEQFSDSGIRQLGNYVDLLGDAYRHKRVTTWCPTRQHVNEVAIEGLLGSLVASRHDGSPTAYPSTAPCSLKLRAVANAQVPSFTVLNRYRLLHILVERCGFLTDHSSQQDLPGPFENLHFNDLTMPGTFSGPYTAMMADVWERNLFGLKLCVIVPEREMDAMSWERYTAQGSAWAPEGRERLIILSKDDVLFIPSSVRTVYTFHVLETCLVEGGIIWDSYDIVDTLQSMHEITPEAEQAITLKPLLHRLSYLVAELQILVAEDWGRFSGRESKEKFQERFNEAIGKLRFPRPTICT